MGIQLPYAIKNGDLIHISEIPVDENGLRCGCICPFCEQKLLARIGKTRVHHFAHLSDCDPNSAIQTMLHLLAKDIIANLGEFYLPKHLLYYYGDGLEKDDYASEDSADDSFPNANYHRVGDHHFEMDSYRKTYIDYRTYIESVRGGLKKIDSVRVESRLSNIIPDIVIAISGIEIIVEIAVTHKVDREKLKRINDLNVFALEVDLSKFYKVWKNTKDVGQLVSTFTHFSPLVKWIHVPSDQILINEEIRKQKLIVSEREKLEAIQRAEREKKEAAELAKQKRLQAKMEAINRTKIEQAKSMYETENYNKLLEKHAQEIGNNKLWRSMLKKYPIKPNIYPDIINTPIWGEIIFGCDRRIWQGAIYFYLVYEKEGLSCSFVDRVMLEWMKDTLYQVLIYTSNLRENGMPTHGDVIKEYFQHLMDNGVIESDEYVKWRKYYKINK